MSFVIATAAVLAGLVLVPGSVAAHRVRHCGNSHNPSHPWGHLRARRIGCRGARKVANRYSPSHQNPRGFHCVSRPSPVGEGDHVRCHRTRNGRRQRVSFLYGT